MERVEAAGAARPMGYRVWLLMWLRRAVAGIRTPKVAIMLWMKDTTDLSQPLK